MQQPRPLQGFANPWIYAHLGGIVPNLKDAKTGQGDFVAGLDVIGGECHQVAQLLRDNLDEKERQSG